MGHTDGIVGHTLKTSEEDYNIYRLGTFLFLAGQQSLTFLHGILQTPSPRYDEHTTDMSTNKYRYQKKVVFKDSELPPNFNGIYFNKQIFELDVTSFIYVYMYTCVCLYKGHSESDNTISHSNSR